MCSQLFCSPSYILKQNRTEQLSTGTNGDRGVLSYRGLTDGLRLCQVRRASSLIRDTILHPGSDIWLKQPPIIWAEITAKRAYVWCRTSATSYTKPRHITKSENPRNCCSVWCGCCVVSHNTTLPPKTCAQRIWREQRYNSKSIAHFHSWSYIYIYMWRNTPQGVHHHHHHHFFIITCDIPHKLYNIKKLVLRKVACVNKCLCTGGAW